MRRFFKEMFSEKSQVSAVRVMSFISLMTACIIAFIGLFLPTVDYSGLAMLSGAFLSASFGGKVFQKHIEKRGESAPKE